MRAIELIHKKREGGRLSRAELQFLIAGYTKGTIPDYQMAAFSMAVFFRGMDSEETAFLTDAMMRSGDMMDLSRFGTRSADKHSTGGVGDKTTLIIAPIVAVLGGKLAKLSGRGLGHTGGTVDKLESIPGFRTVMSEADFLRQVEELGVAVIGQTGNLTPADKKLYALRDVTDTVDSLPLIAASIMSKKLAAGAQSMVLDVKVGAGAFMKDVESARRLAAEMVDIGTHCGRSVTALLTNMDAPLGCMVGNAVEVMEASEILRGRGDPALRRLSVLLAANLLALCHGWTVGEAEARVTACIDGGQEFEMMERWVAAQGGDAAALRDFSRLPQAAYRQDVRAERSGYLTAMDALAVGAASSLLGAGREKKGDEIDAAAGIELFKKPGDFVRAGEPVARLFTNRASVLDGAHAHVISALRFHDAPPPESVLIYEIVRSKQ